MSEWLPGAPEFRDTPVRPVRREVICPKCKEGTMWFTGTSWPTGDPGYHHKCSICEYVAAIRGGQYPKIVYVDINEAP